MQGFRANRASPYPLSHVHPAEDRIADGRLYSILAHTREADDENHYAFSSLPRCWPGCSSALRHPRWAGGFSLPFLLCQPTTREEVSL